MLNHTKLGFADTYAAMDLSFQADLAAIIYSDPGHGKTSMVKKYAADQGPHTCFCELNGSLANVPDFMGWFYRSTERHLDFDGDEVTIENGKYTFPYFLFDKFSRRPIFQFKKAIICVEEYGQTDADVRKGLGQMTLEKRVGQYQLPPETKIVMLSNYQGGRNAVGKDFDFLINRRTELHYQLTSDDFNAYGYDIGMEMVTMAFASLPQHHVFDGGIPAEQGPMLTPRSLEALDRLLKVALATKTDLDDPVLRVTASGIVGQGAAHQFIAFTKLRDKIPTIEQIVKDPVGTPVPGPEHTDQRMFIVFSMADAATKANIKPLIRYLGRLPADMAVAFYKNALLRDRTLMSCREFGDWAVANKQLLAVVNSRA